MEILHFSIFRSWATLTWSCISTHYFCERFMATFFHRLYLYLNKCQIPNQTYNLLPKHFKGMQQSMKIFLPLPTINHPGTIVFRILSIHIELFFLKRCWRIGKNVSYIFI